MSCCSAKTIEDKLQPYELRSMYICQIRRLCKKGVFGEAINVFRELSSNLGVTSGRKRLSRLGIADLISAKEFLVDRDAFIYLDRYVHLNAIIKSRNYGFLDLKDGWIYWEHGMEPSNFMALRSTHEPGVICELILCLVLSSQSFSIPLEI
ncbi:PREDICTED: uncharacterized protein LOC107332383 [Acropora digitifera]|uniref:uncharacterized protein LOC107332383 n=1 Tax=Acropora digitifera TaxID=70779 RepID=UPI00077AA98D|nr:PREDICTED: uncharacterized protein LOC107332383 [Acropora digitifera]